MDYGKTESGMVTYHFCYCSVALISCLFFCSRFNSQSQTMTGWLISGSDGSLRSVSACIWHLTDLSLVMLILTFFLGIISVIISWKEIDSRVGFFHFNLLLILAGITGVFLSLDLFLFYFFWELMLVPMYFLIGIWGHENRTAASNKFFLYTQASGLLMFIAIIALYFVHGNSTGIYTFDYTATIGN